MKNQKSHLTYYITVLITVALVAGCTTLQVDNPDQDLATAPPVALEKRGEFSGYDATVRWTDYGIPHIKAADWGSLGYGSGYARAKDALCVLAEAVITTNGERSKYFVNSEGNFNSDVFYKALLDQAALNHSRQILRPEMTAMSAGFVAGYNRYLADTGTDLTDSCAGKPWLRPMTDDDMSRLLIDFGIRYGLGNVMGAIANASPPESDSRVASSDTHTVKADEISFPDVEQQGSNAYAIGKALTSNGRGLLLGNPHYPWQGPSRFHMEHLTIPGEVDVMGVGLYTTPFIGIGFNQDIAWTHTVSTALRFTLYELALVAGNPLAYYYGDEIRKLEKRVVAVEVPLPDGNIEVREHDVYMSHFGPVIVSKDTPWTNQYAYVIRDVNLLNNRSSEQYYRLAKAKSVAEIKSALFAVQGVSFVNTIATDKDGAAFYGDVSAIPNVDIELLQDCKSPHVDSVSGRKVVVLDGSRPECEWRIDSTAAAPGIMPPSKLPFLITDEYVTNSNDSYWLSNPKHRLEGFSPIIGNEKAPRSLRTRAGLKFIDEVISDGNGKFSAGIVQKIMYNQRNYGAEILLDDLLAICQDAPVATEVLRACDTLTAWDRRQATDSRGAQVYTEFWRNASKIKNLYAVPFSVDDPVNTPRGINIADASVRASVMAALEQAVKTLQDAEITLDASWGSVQYIVHKGEKIGIPGGSGGAGMFSNISAKLKKGAGYTPVVAGNSYIQVVTWNADGQPDVSAVLTYSQTQERGSEHYSDQTRLYSKGQWLKLPYRDEDIEKQVRYRKRLVTDQ